CRPGIPGVGSLSWQSELSRENTRPLPAGPGTATRAPRIVAHGGAEAGGGSPYGRDARMRMSVPASPILRVASPAAIRRATRLAPTHQLDRTARSRAL